MSDSGEARREAKVSGGKRRGRLKRVCRALAIVLVIAVLALCVLLYNPVRTLATLEQVKQGHTVWSIVYGLGTGHVRVAMGKDYDHVHRFQLEMKESQ